MKVTQNKQTLLRFAYFHLHTFEEETQQTISEKCSSIHGKKRGAALQCVDDLHPTEMKQTE